MHFSEKLSNKKQLMLKVSVQASTSPQAKPNPLAKASAGVHTDSGGGGSLMEGIRVPTPWASGNGGPFLFKLGGSLKSNFALGIQIIYCLFFKNARAMAKIGISTTSDRETRSQIAMFAPESRSGIK